jgi:hypothetical protein
MVENKMTLAEKYSRVKDDFDITKESPEKHLEALNLAYDENFDTKDEYGLKMRPKDWVALTIEPAEFKKTLAQGKALGFGEAYEQNPSFMKQNVEKVIKRISALDANHIPYINAKGKYQSTLFSERAFNYVLSQQSQESKPLLEESNNDLFSSNHHSITDYAERLIETFNLTPNAQAIYEKLASIQTTGKAPRDVLLEIFKEYADDEEYLETCIDEIINFDKENKRGLVA